MHRTYDFPINCESPQIPVKKPSLITSELGTFILGDLDKESMSAAYDAFNKVDIIPDLLNVAEKISQNNIHDEHPKNLRLVEKWVKKWGFLKAEAAKFEEESIYGQRVGFFIDEARKFYDLWTLYTIIANKDIEKLKQIIKIHVNNEPEFKSSHIFSFFENRFYGEVSEGIFREEDPLRSYQIEAMTYIGGQLEPYINNHKLHWASLRHEPAGKQDRYKFKPGLAFPDLIDALYMQFFIIMNENNKKICPICNHPFLPDRIDQLYCAESCKLTARSRRYRARKKSII